jgi:hypothetical protein
LELERVRVLDITLRQRMKEPDIAGVTKPAPAASNQASGNFFEARAVRMRRRTP